MQLSSVYLYEKIKEKYEITERGTLSGSDGYLRPFLCYEKKETFRHGHVYVVQRYAKEWESAVLSDRILTKICSIYLHTINVFATSTASIQFSV